MRIESSCHENNRNVVRVYIDSIDEPRLSQVLEVTIGVFHNKYPYCLSWTRPNLKRCFYLTF